MLRKLLKYEIKATARILLPLYLVVLLFGFINRFLNPFNAIEASNSFNLHAVLSMFSIILYIGLIVGIIVMTFIIMIQRFYKNLLGDEGYLMFTLPVRSWEHIISKLLVSMLWIILSFLTVICSILIIANINNLFGELSNVINSIRNYIGNAGLLLIPICLLVEITYSIVTIYDAISLGHLFTKHKLLASFGAYIVLYIISQITFGVFMLVYATTNLNLFTNKATPTPSQIIIFAASATCLYLLLAVGNFILTNVILKKRLNLE